MSELRLKNPSLMPIGGWQFRQMEIGWKAPNPMSEGLNALAGRVQQLRLNNPVLVRHQLPTDLGLIKNEILAYNHALHPEIFIDQEAAASSLRASSVATTRAERKVGCCGGGK